MTTAKKTTAERITDIVKEYYTVPSDTTDIVRLIDIRKRLAVLLYGFAAEVGSLYLDRASAEYRRKSEQGKIMAKALADGKSVAASEQMAKAETDEATKDELMTDALHRQSTLILNAGNEVLAAIQQQIAFARREHHAETTGQGSQ